MCLRTKKGFRWTSDDLSEVRLTGVWSVYAGVGVGAGASGTFLAASTGVHRVRSRFRIPIVNRDAVCEAIFAVLPGSSNLARPKF